MTLPYLEELYVSGCDSVSDIGMSYISQMKNIKKLFASLCPLLTDEGTQKSKNHISNS